MKIRNKKTGQIFEVMAGTLYPDFFEEVVEDIKIGEPKIEVEIEEMKEEPKKSEKKPKKTTKKAKKSTKKAKKGAKKNATSKE